ncbi:molybdopterin molybdotransferase MoeA [Candidatus Desantisbacteria bacterium]|nr:molybdopterin molybdotransferase MoeA [Candidatus Desantisbacteria bacterium]
MIKITQALDIILNSIKILPPEEVHLEDALNRILREDISADMDIPPFDNSAMDGYAVKAEDIKNASIKKPVYLKVIDDIPAGYISGKILNYQEASLIMTGAPIPDGADCVIIVEHTHKTHDPNHVEIFFPGKCKDNIRFKGEDIKKGETALNAGTTIKSSDIGLLAALGKSKIKVGKKPVVSIIGTGDELIDIEKSLVPGKIRCSTKEDVVSHLNKGKEADVFITTGGISVGKYDVVKDAMKSLGGEFKFWQIAMKPGKPFAFCIWEGKPMFGLPGNPISSAISFEQFVRPALLLMSGKKDISLPIIAAILDSDITKKPGVKYFARCKVYIKDGEFRAEIQGPHGSNMLKPLTRSNGLVVMEEDSTIAKRGEKVEVQLIDNINF